MKQKLPNTRPRRESVPLSLRKAVLTRDGYRCTKCGHGPWMLTVDHIKPVSHGGATVMSNLRAFCSTCNTKRSNKAERTADNGYAR